MNGSEDRTDRMPTHCSTGVSPVMMTGFFVQMMRQHFVNPGSIVRDAFRERLWNQSACASGINVADGSVWDPTRAGNQPSVVVKRNKWQIAQKMSIGSRYRLTTEGHWHYSAALAGSHTLFAIAKAGAEVEILTEEVYRFALTMAPVIRKEFNLLSFELLDIGEIGILKEATELYAVPITVAYAWEESWVLHQDAPLLKRLTLSADIRE